MKGFSFSKKIILVAISVVVISFGGYALFNDHIQQKAVTESVRSYIEDVGNATANSLSEWLNTRMQLVGGAAQLVRLQQTDSDIEQLVSLATYNEHFSLTYFGLSESPTFIRNPPIAMPDGYDFRTRPTYKSAVAAGGLTLLEPYVDAATGDLVASIAAPVSRDGMLKGVFGVDLSLATLVDLVVGQKIGGLGYTFLVNGNGKILVSPDQEQVNKSVAEVFGLGGSTVSETFASAHTRDGERILYFKAIPNLPGQHWYVGFSIDKNLAYAQLHQSRVSASVALTVIVASIAVILGLLIKLLLVPVHSINHAMREIAEGDGDLTKRLKSTSMDEFGQLSRSFNLFVERISASISAVDSTTRQLNVLSRQVLESSRSALATSEEQADRVLVVAASVEELGATAQEIASNAALGAGEASKVRVMSDQGQQLAQDSIQVIKGLSDKVAISKQSIESLNQRTEKIGTILDVIKGISEQTNLLALNAAIEAARAGEAGRGFAVVADEVRNLAHRAQTSALEINAMISELQADARVAVSKMLESQDQGESSVGMIQETGDSITEITKGIGEIDRMNLSVAAATEEQTSVVHSLSSEINDISKQNREFTEGLNRNIQSCAGLDEQAHRLQQLVAGFKLA